MRASQPQRGRGESSPPTQKMHRWEQRPSVAGNLVHAILHHKPEGAQRRAELGAIELELLAARPPVIDVGKGHHHRRHRGEKGIDRTEQEGHGQAEAEWSDGGRNREPALGRRLGRFGQRDRQVGRSGHRAG